MLNNVKFVKNVLFIFYFVKYMTNLKYLFF